MTLKGRDIGATNTSTSSTIASSTHTKALAQLMLTKPVLAQPEQPKSAWARPRLIEPEVAKPKLPTSMLVQPWLAKPRPAKPVKLALSKPQLAKAGVANEQA